MLRAKSRLVASVLHFLKDRLQSTHVLRKCMLRAYFVTWRSKHSAAKKQRPNDNLPDRARHLGIE